MENCLNLPLPERKNLIPSKYLVRSVITSVLPVSFLNDEILMFNRLFNARDSVSDKYLSTLSNQ